MARRIGRPLLRLALLVAALACVWLPSPRGFTALGASPLPAPPARLRPAQASPAITLRERKPAPATTVETPVETKEDEDVRTKKNTTSAFNMTLELSSGYPTNGPDSGTDQGPPWAKCIVEYQDRSTRDEYGTVMPKHMLEEWVMRGSREHLSTFRSWRGSGLKDAAASSTRCTEIEQASVEEVTCIECVSPVGARLPSPSPFGGFQGTLGPSSQTAFDGTIAPSAVLTFEQVPQCLLGSSGRIGFCKSGSVALPM